MSYCLHWIWSAREPSVPSDVFARCPLRADRRMRRPAIGRKSFAPLPQAPRGVTKALRYRSSDSCLPMRNSLQHGCSSEHFPAWPSRAKRQQRGEARATASSSALSYNEATSKLSLAGVSVSARCAARLLRIIHRAGADAGTRESDRSRSLKTALGFSRSAMVRSERVVMCPVSFPQRRFSSTRLQPPGCRYVNEGAAVTWSPSPTTG